MTVTILVALLAQPAKAQTFDYNKAFEDYQYNLTLYRQSFSDYENAKNAYLQGGQTLPLKEAARQKTLAMLKTRNQLLVVYLTALRQKIVEDRGLVFDEKNTLFGKIDQEVAWYLSDKSNYRDSDSLENLFTKNEAVKDRFKKNTSLVVSEVLIYIGVGEQAGLRIDHENIYSTLKSIIDAGVASGKLSLTPFNHWLSDIDATDQLLKDKESAAKAEIQKIYSQSYSPKGNYESSLEILSSSLLPLSQLNEFLTEVLNYIKNQ